MELAEPFESSFEVALSPFFAALQAAGRPPASALQLLDPSMNLASGRVASYDSVVLSHCVATRASSVRPSFAVRAAEDFGPAAAFVLHEEAAGDALVKSVHFQTVGHGHRALNRVSVQICAGQTEAHDEQPEAADVEEFSRDCPWLNARGQLVEPMLRLFATKLVAIVADSPGCGLKRIQGGFSLLSDPQLAELLAHCVRNRLIREKISSCSVKKLSPFAVSGVHGDNSSSVGYFVWKSVNFA